MENCNLNSLDIDGLLELYECNIRHSCYCPCECHCFDGFEEYLDYSKSDIRKAIIEYHSIPSFKAESEIE